MRDREFAVRDEHQTHKQDMGIFQERFEVKIYSSKFTPQATGFRVSFSPRILRRSTKLSYML